jgi:quercetin dioxygenase-like cupin family protein
MIIKTDMDIPEALLMQEDINKVAKKVLIGPEDGSSNIIMRKFKVLPGGNTPYHTHPFEHVIRVAKNKGVVQMESGEEMVVHPGHNLFIAKNERHQFKNPYPEPFEFLCIILNPENI